MRNNTNAKFPTSKPIFRDIIIAIVIFALAVLVIPAFTSNKPHTLKHDTDKITALLDIMAFVTTPPVNPVDESNTRSSQYSTDKTPTLYTLSFRSCPPCISHFRTQPPKLHAAGIETKLLMFLRTPLAEDHPERRVLAHLYQSPDPKLLADWMARTSPARFYGSLNQHPLFAKSQMSQAEQNRRVKAQQALVAQFGEILSANDITFATPTHIWQNASGQWRVAIGNHALTNRKIMAELTAQIR